MSSHSENHSRTNGSACKHPVLRVSHLWKVFKVRSGSCQRTEDLVAVDDVSFELPRSSTAAPPHRTPPRHPTAAAQAQLQL